MPPIPNLTKLELVFGKADHLPPYDKLPRDYQDMRATGCRAAQTWFFSGDRVLKEFSVVPREGVDKAGALTAIQAALASFEPSHEHKIGGCGWLLDQWFVVTPKKAAP